MNETHRKNKTGVTSLDFSKFSMQIYISCQDQQKYFYQLLNYSCLSKDINQQCMNIKELNDILTTLPITFTNKQLHQLYLYATFQNGADKKTNEKRPISLVNLEPNKINLNSAAKWIEHKIQKNKLRFNPQNNRQLPYRGRSIFTQSTNMKTQKQKKLPVIKIKPAQRFTHEVGRVLDIFSQIEKQRQNAGLQPICISQDQQQKSGQPVKQIHYDGDFFEVNKKIFKLRQEARQGIHEVIQAAKQDKKLKRKFEEALMRYERVRTQTNQKTGRCGAMKAQKRIIDKQKQQIRKLDLWRQKTNQTDLATINY